MVHALEDADAVVGVALFFVGEKDRAIIPHVDVQVGKNAPRRGRHRAAFSADPRPKSLGRRDRYLGQQGRRHHLTQHVGISSHRIKVPHDELVIGGRQFDRQSARIRFGHQLAHPVGNHGGHFHQLPAALFHGLPAALVALTVTGSEVLAAVQLVVEHAKAGQPNGRRALACRPQVHLDAVAGVYPGRQIDEVLGVWPHFAPDAQALQAIGHRQSRSRLDHERHAVGVEGHIGAEEVIRIQQVAITGGAQLKTGGPLGHATFGQEGAGEVDFFGYGGERFKTRLCGGHLVSPDPKVGFVSIPTAI